MRGSTTIRLLPTLSLDMIWTLVSIDDLRSWVRRKEAVGIIPAGFYVACWLVLVNPSACSWNRA
jgi:hypothetical protein